MTLPSKKAQLRSTLHRQLSYISYMRRQDSAGVLGNEVTINDLDHYVRRSTPTDGRGPVDALVGRYAQGQYFVGDSLDELQAQQDRFLDGVIDTILHVAEVSDGWTWIDKLEVTFLDEQTEDFKSKTGLEVVYHIRSLMFDFGLPPYRTLSPAAKAGYDEHRFRLVSNRGEVLFRAATLSEAVERYHGRETATGDVLMWYNAETKEWITLIMDAVRTAWEMMFALVHPQLDIHALTKPQVPDDGHS